VSVRRVAVLNDIHGNLPALDAVLDEVREAGVDRIVVGGDVLPGPMPRETFKRLMDVTTPIEYLYGNGDVAVLEQLSGREPSKVPEPYWPMIRWNAGQLDADSRRLLASWPKLVTLQIDGLGEVLFCHATPRNEDEIFTRVTPDAALLPIFEPLTASVVVCGHTHMQFDRTIGRTRVVNAGSVGMPFGAPGADWLLLGPGIELRHTTYDLEKAAARMRAIGGPSVEEFSVRIILQPPSEATILEAYALASIK
jgi:putative phosphoesterase